MAQSKKAIAKEQPTAQLSTIVPALSPAPQVSAEDIVAFHDQQHLSGGGQGNLAAASSPSAAVTIHTP